jgi:hypothetical protein
MTTHKATVSETCEPDMIVTAAADTGTVATAATAVRAPRPRSQRPYDAALARVAAARDELEGAADAALDLDWTLYEAAGGDDDPTAGLDIVHDLHGLLWALAALAPLRDAAPVMATAAS